MLSNAFLPEIVNPLDENLFNTMEQNTLSKMDFWVEEPIRRAKKQTYYMVRLTKYALSFFDKTELVIILFSLFFVNSYSQDRIYNYYCEKYDTKSSSINYYDKEGAIIDNIDSIEFLDLVFYKPKDLYRLKLLAQCTNLKCLVLDTKLDTLIIESNLLNSEYLHCLFINGWYLKYCLIDSINVFDSIYNFGGMSYNSIDLQFIFKYLKNLKAIRLTSTKMIDLNEIDNLKDLEIIEIRYFIKIEEY